MALKIKSSPSLPTPPVPSNPGQIIYEYSPQVGGIPFPPPGIPQGIPVYSYVGANPVSVPAPPPIDMAEASLPRALNYYADYGGCGFWRMIWPENALNSYQRACISGLTAMVMDIRFYHNLKAIRFQRQATPIQNSFMKELHKIKKEIGFRVLYEVDDIVFREDIPEYNRCKEAFVSDEIVNNITEIMSEVDEVTVTCKFMKDYYIEKTGNKRITVIPNYAPKSWLDRFYDKNRLEEIFDKNKKRPRVLYAGSGTHIDTTGKAGMMDDFAHVIQDIIKARKKFKFVWKGAFPLALKPYIDNGEMEWIDWSPLPDYPRGLFDTGCSVSFAPLMDNIFNKSKSNIKMLEHGALGIPGAYQDLVTYEGAERKFKHGRELIEQLEYITSDFDRYMRLSAKARTFAEGLWLEDHLDEYEALYFTEWGSKERKEKSSNLILLNPDQDLA